MAENSRCSEPGDGCSEPGGHIVRGLCGKHYQRWLKYGKASDDVLVGVPKTDGKATRAFVLAAANSDDEECILWPFRRSTNGYGVVSWEGKGWPAHRLVLSLATGLNPSRTIFACHVPGICHNRLCVNPRHLRWDTPTGNSMDRWVDDTMIMGELCHQAKLTREDVWAIRRSGEPDSSTAERYGVTRGTINDIRRGTKWRWLPNEDGSPFDPRTTEAAERTALEAIRLIALGTMNDTEIGLAIGTCTTTVGNIRRGLTWRHLPRPWGETPPPTQRKRAA